MLDIAKRDDALGQQVRRYLQSVEDQIYQTLLQGQKDGKIAPGEDLRALSRFFLSTARAITLMHRVYGDTAQIKDIANVALSVLEQHK